MQKRDLLIIGGGAALTAAIGAATYELMKPKPPQAGTTYPVPVGGAFPGAGTVVPPTGAGQAALVPPTAPTNVRITGVTSTAVTVSWMPVPGYDHYQVIHPAYVATHPGEMSTPELIVADVRSNVAAINGLAANSPYSVWVVAVGPTGIQGPRSSLAQGSTLAAGAVGAPIIANPPPAAGTSTGGATPVAPVTAPAVPVSTVVSQINGGAAPSTVAAQGNFTGEINGHYYRNGQEVTLAQYMGPGWTPTQVPTPAPVTSGPTYTSAITGQPAVAGDPNEPVARGVQIINGQPHFVTTLRNGTKIDEGLAVNRNGQYVLA